MFTNGIYFNSYARTHDIKVYYILLKTGLGILDS